MSIPIINLVTRHNAGEFSDLIEDMHRLRYRVFKEKLDWDVGGHRGQEHDEFDHAEAAYLIASDEQNRARGCWRLLPTTGDYMASTVFRCLFDGMDRLPPASSRIWECSRFCVDPGEKARQVEGLEINTAFLLTALTEFALTYGVNEIVTVEELAVARLMQKALDRRPLWRGRAQQLGPKRAVVAGYGIDSTLLDHLRQKYVVPAPVVTQLALWNSSEAA